MWPTNRSRPVTIIWHPNTHRRKGADAYTIHISWASSSVTVFTSPPPPSQHQNQFSQFSTRLLCACGTQSIRKKEHSDSSVSGYCRQSVCDENLPSESVSVYVNARARLSTVEYAVNEWIQNLNNYDSGKIIYWFMWNSNYWQ